MKDNVSIVKEDINRVLRERALFDLLKDKRVLITGVTGVIGSMLARVLLAADESFGLGLQVIGLVRSEARAQEMLGDLTQRPALSLVCSESFSVDVPCDYIIHTAAPTKSKYFVEHPAGTIRTSLEGTTAMLELAKKYDAKMVYLSSMEEYGIPYEAGQVMTEDKIGVIDHLTARSCYPESKRMCECMCAAYHVEYGVDASIVRLAQTFGAGVPLSDNRVFMMFARSAIEKKDIVLHTDGSSVSNFCYLSDAVSGILTVMLMGKPGEAYNVCFDSQSMRIREIAAMVAEKIAGNQIKLVIDIPENVNFGYAPSVDMRLCSDKLKALGWNPVVTMENAYRNLIRYIEEAERA